MSSDLSPLSSHEIPGWMTAAELSEIRAQARGRGDVLEIGTYCGRSTWALLHSATGLVFTCDPLTREPDEQRRWLSALTAEYPTRLILLPALSQHLLFTRPIDVLMIDGDHSYHAVLHDLNTFAPLVTPGGRLLLHDMPDPDVSRAAREFFERSSGWTPSSDVDRLSCWTRNGL